MNEQSTTNTIGQRTSPVRTSNAAGYSLALNLDLDGVDQEQMTLLHVQSGLHEAWPFGLLGHITNFIPGGAHSLVIWNDRDHEREYFRTTALDMITDFVPTLAAAQPDQPVSDFEFQRSHIHKLVLSSDCLAFADIGADLERASIGVLGTQPVAARFDLPGVTVEEFDAAVAPLAYDAKLPHGLLIELVEITEDGLLETQIWSAEKHASAELRGRLGSALAELTGDDLQPRIDEISRISLSGSELARIFDEDD